VPLSRREVGIVEVFFSIFAHHPLCTGLELARTEPAPGARQVYGQKRDAAAGLA
jgi:hypothetical protein